MSPPRMRAALRMQAMLHAERLLAWFQEEDAQFFCARSKAAAPGRRAEHRSLSQAAPTVRERKTRALKGFPPKRQLRHKNCNLPRCNASVAPRERGAERGGTRERGQPRGQRRGRAPGGERQRAGVARVRRQVGRIERVERRGPGARRARDRRVALPPPPPPGAELTGSMGSQALSSAKKKF